MTTDKKMNGNADGLEIPAALRRTPGSNKPAGAKAAPAKPAVTKTPAKPKAAPKAPKGKAPTAKQIAQQAAGVKVTEAAKPAATPPAPPAAAKPAPAGKPVAELLKAVKKHGKHFAHKNGWDLLIAQSDSEITQAFEGATSKAAAIKAARKAAQALDKKRPKDQPAPERAR